MILRQRHTISIARGLLALPFVLPLLAPASVGAEERVRVGEMLADPAALAAWLERKSPEVRAAAARLGQSRADLGQSRLLPNPSLSLGLADVTVGATNPLGLGLAETAIWSANLSETVELGKRGPRIASARLRLDSGRETYLDALVGRIAEARQALGRVAYLGSRRAALEESRLDSRRILELQEARFEHGDLSETTSTGCVPTPSCWRRRSRRTAASTRPRWRRVGRSSPRSVIPPGPSSRAWMGRPRRPRPRARLGRRCSPAPTSGPSSSSAGPREKTRPWRGAGPFPIPA